MGNGLVLKFKGNKSFVAFSNLGDAEALTKTWKVCTKVAAHLEQGQRLENLSWRLWHLQNLMVESDNAKSKREFRKLSKHMGEKLDKEKGRSIEELAAPRFHRNQSSDKVRRLAEEKERIRETHSHATGHRLNRMQFTFPVDAPSAMKTEATSKSSPQVRRSDSKDLLVSTKKASKAGLKPKFLDQDRSSVDTDATMLSPTSPNNNFEAAAIDPSLSPSSNGYSNIVTNSNANDDQFSAQPGTLRFPTLFSDDFAPTALLYPTANFVPSLSYGEGVGSRDSFGVTRPTIEVPLDELLGRSSSPEDAWMYGITQNIADTTIKEEDSNSFGNLPTATSATFGVSGNTNVAPDIDRAKTPKQQSVQAQSTTNKPTIAPLTVTTKNLSVSRGRRSSTAAARASALASATAPLNQPKINTNAQNSNANATSNTTTTTTTTNGKSECVNCGATHTPLWRRGLNDELNCNACGLYCKLHKRPRPKTIRQQNAESGRPSGNQKSDPAESMGEPGTKQRKNLKRTPHESRGAARCVNCHTMATPLWRKDDEGKTVCNACGLYFKLHNSNRPISMKSDVIRKRSRHDQRPSMDSVSETPSASPSASRRSSPERDLTPSSDDKASVASQPPASAAAPGSPAHPMPDPFDPAHRPFNFPADEFEFPVANSPQPSQADIGGFNMTEIMGIANQVGSQAGGGGWTAPQYPTYPEFEGSSLFPGPFHPDYLRSLGVNIGEAHMQDHLQCHQSGDSSDSPQHSSPADRGSKRRRLSTDSYQSSLSATEPPSSASSFFPHDNSSNSSFSSIGFSTPSTKSHRRNISRQESDVSAHQTDEEETTDFPMELFHPTGVPAEQEREIMAALLRPTHGPSPNVNAIHPPMLPFTDYSDTNEYMNVAMGLFNPRF